MTVAPDPTKLPVFTRRAATVERPTRLVEAAAASTDPAGIPLHGLSPDRSADGGQHRGRRAARGVDWQLVAAFRAQASDQLTRALGEDRAALDPTAERELGRSIIQELLQSAAGENVSAGREAWSLDEQHQMAEAIYDALFGLGRLQPLVDDPTIENIVITGHDNVWLERTDGTLTKVAPVADSDAELIEFLSFLASRSEVNARAFAPSRPTLHMRLDGGARLAAAAWVTPRPSVVIRRHGLRRVTLDDLVARGTLSPVIASFLAAAVKARKSIVVAGPQGAGKTTLVRALCAQIPPTESIGTFETEYELHLHELTDQHYLVHPFEARPGTGELGPDGRPAGEFTLGEAIDNSFRFNLSRQIVGEVRGAEVWPMIKVMESGAGSISTTHSTDAEGAIRKLVTCAMEAGPHVTRELATSKLAATVDIVVQLSLAQTQIGPQEWRRERWVSQVIAVEEGELPKGYAVTEVFVSSPNGPATAAVLPDHLHDLERHGFDLDAFLDESHLHRGGRS